MTTARSSTDFQLSACAWVVGAGLWTLANAQAQGIYTCTDGKGRRITSDRPIVECLDREQHQLGKTGIVRQVVPPSYTADERAKIEDRQRAENEIKARAAEEKRRERALLIRYPNQVVHDKERTEALAQIDEVIAAVNKREVALKQQRKEVETEMEFYPPQARGQRQADGGAEAVSGRAGARETAHQPAFRRGAGEVAPTVGADRSRCGQQRGQALKPALTWRSPFTGVSGAARR